MGVATQCGRCGRQYNLEAHLAGKLVRCKECGEPIRVPLPAAVAPPAPVMPSGPHVPPSYHRPPQPGSMPLVNPLGLPPIAASRPRRRMSASGRRKILLVSGVVGGVLALVALGWGTYAILGKTMPEFTASLENSVGGLIPAALGGSERERVMRDLIAMLNEMADELSHVHDVASAAAAQQRLQELAAGRSDLEFRVRNLKSTMTPEESLRLEREYRAPLEAAVRRVMGELRRVAAISGSGISIPGMNGEPPPVHGFGPEMPSTRRPGAPGWRGP